MVSFASEQEKVGFLRLMELYESSPIPKAELMANLGLFTGRGTLGRLLFLHEMYQKIIPVHGVIIEFGVRWGLNLALFSSLRSLYEPFNTSRKIIGFDTFEGLLGKSAMDGDLPVTTDGSYSVTPGYEAHLDEILKAHALLGPRAHLEKHKLVKGDVSETLPRYLQDHPETIVSLAYFDMDIYAPTKTALVLIRDHLTKGSVVGFDELGMAEFPGETLALRECLGLSAYAIRRCPFSNHQAYIVIE
jgi:hypothetical protein